ncbi:thiolase family protein [Novosphingobium sp.]|uniref:thiolase family protein n=1 Tax=Novosphingobium sp. TaxID=1874826 RepID=UPI0038BAE901
MDCFIIGVGMTAFGKRPNEDHRALAREALLLALRDAGLPDGQQIEQAFFGSVLMHRLGQTMIRGQVVLREPMAEGLLPRRMPVTNVEGACATSSIALASARAAVLSGTAGVALALGVEKMFDSADPAAALAEIGGGFDNLDPASWHAEYARAAVESGGEWCPGPDRSIAMDTYGLQAQWHMHRHGTTQRQIACAAAKSHRNGVLNPNAQYRFPMTTDDVLADRPVSGPLTRAMCAPIGDGSSAAIVCSEAVLATLPAETRESAVRIRATGVSGGAFRGFGEPSLSRVAADKAYAAAGVAPEAIDLVEVHDATSFSEIFQAEMLRFCEEGKGGALVEAGETEIDGKIPMNTSGGLVSKGHPIAATGLSMIHEVVTQLRGKAGARQVGGARIGMTENGGGVIGFEEAICVVNILDQINR